MATNRREANKARTRDALLGALRENVSRSGLEGLTAETVAEGAGVSRRTFFNYFPSVEDALAQVIAGPLAELGEAFLARPADEQPLDAVAAALRDRPFDAELLGWIHTIGCAERARVGVSPLAHGLWSHHRSWLEGVLAERLATDDRLRASTLAAAVMGIFDVVEQAWLAELGASPLDAAAVARFNDLLATGLAHARSGWAAPGA